LPCGDGHTVSLYTDLGDSNLQEVLGVSTELRGQLGEFVQVEGETDFIRTVASEGEGSALNNARQVGKQDAVNRLYLD
jgi:hypothetical protein